MNARNRVLLSGLVALLLVPVAMCRASSAPEGSSAPRSGQINYISGSDNLAQTIGREAAGYPLELEFLWGRGAKETPVGNVEWSIRDPAGDMLVETFSRFPDVLASLPDGRYTVTAIYDGKSISRVVNVHKGAHEIVALEWPQ